MVKHPQTIRRQNALFEFLWPFCGIGALRVKIRKKETIVESYPDS